MGARGRRDGNKERAKKKRATMSPGPE